MNIFDIVQGTRPPIDPMPVAKRQMIRESLFGAGYDDAARTISGRSDSGAVVSTAPHGMRVPSAPRRGPGLGSIVKTAAGLLVVGLVGAFIWSSYSGEEAVAPTDSTAPATTEAVETTTSAAPVEAPPERTGVSRAMPLVLPSTQLAADEIVIAPAGEGVGDVLLTAPDGTTLWLAEFDGAESPLDDLDVQQVGSIGVAAVEAPTAVSYRFQVPCGVVIMNDAPGQPAFRPAVTALLEATSIDASAAIDISLPDGWSVLDLGESADAFITQFQLPLFAETTPVRLTQIPGGSLSQLTFGGRQLTPTTFLGAPAFVDSAPPTPETVSVYWRDADTVFSITAQELTLDDIERFVVSLEPGTVDSWTSRFAAAVPNPAPADPTCEPQPSFGSTLDP